MNNKEDHDFIQAILYMDAQIRKHEYRKKAIDRYLNKRKRRTWKKKICKRMSRQCTTYIRDGKGRFGAFIQQWKPITIVQQSTDELFSLNEEHILNI
jgi:hypothetical protein